MNQTTGEVVWKKKIDDYAAGYSATAAPIIANGLLLTGVSGGEFGVVGRVEARDAKTGKMVWEAPNNAPLWGSVLTTGGNLVFWGTPEGFLQAADAKTVAPPITWSDGGEQYVAVASEAERNLSVPEQRPKRRPI